MSMIQKHAGRAMSDIMKYLRSSLQRAANEAGASPGRRRFAASMAA